MPVHQHGRWVHPSRKDLAGESAEAGLSPETDLDTMDVEQVDPSRKRGREEVTGGVVDGGTPETLPGAR